jgi:GT2 family glycosyltransferase
LLRPAISIVVVSYNTRELLRNCLASILTDGEREVEVIVLDNHSLDGSADLVRSEFPGVRLIENSENVGFAKANNQGICEAHGKYVLLLNSDTVVRPGALRAMADFLDGHPGAGGVACRLLNADGTIQASISRRPGPVLLFFRLSRLSHFFRGDGLRRFLRRYLGWLLGATLRGYLDPYTDRSAPFEVENISGACLMLRREAIGQVGLLDENFFMYFEDMDYCLRLRAAGWKLYYVPCVEIVHLGGQSSGGRMRDYSVHSYRSLFYFYRKHYSLWARFFVRFAVLLVNAIRWTRSTIRAWVSGAPADRRNQDALKEVIRVCLKEFPRAASY